MSNVLNWNEQKKSLSSLFH